MCMCINTNYTCPANHTWFDCTKCGQMTALSFASNEHIACKRCHPVKHILQLVVATCAAWIAKYMMPGLYECTEFEDYETIHRQLEELVLKLEVLP